MRLSRNARFAAPIVVAAVIAIGVTVPKLASGDAPHLPPISAAALVDKVAHAHVAGLSGTLSLTSSLGLPAGVSGLAGVAGSSFDVNSLLSGTHHFEVWFGGDQRQRVSLTHGVGETDVVRDGGQVWIYDSNTEKVTHLSVGRGGPPVKRAADALTRHLAPATTVHVGPAVEVAGTSCYTLRLAPIPGTPDARDSTISHIDVAIDAANGIPLRIEVFSSGGLEPALALSFVGSVSFAAPSPAMFAAPRGVTQSNSSLPQLLGGHEALGAFTAKVVGDAWAPVVVLTGVHLGAANALVKLFTVPTHGIPGAPRALRSRLVNVLIYPDGRIVAGLATTDALRAAAGAP